MSRARLSAIAALFLLIGALSGVFIDWLLRRAEDTFYRDLPK